MRSLLLVLLLAHALLHTLGFLKGFGVAPLPQLMAPISRVGGVAWLVAGLLVGVAAAGLHSAPRWGWAVALVAVAVSQAVLCTSWSDARFGTLGNLLLLGAAVHGLAAFGPWSFRARYEAEVSRLLPHSAVADVTEADLAPLPDPVQRYLRRAGVVGRPRIANFRARWQGEIRSGPDAPWMAFTAEQHNFYPTGPDDRERPARLFRMDARMKGLPVDVFHAFIGPAATMRVKVLSLVPMVDAAGPDMNRAETVTLFNDLAILAPSELVDPTIQWQPIDANTARATYTRGGERISAELVVNAAGELVDFVSDDRLAVASDGSTRMRWSTPVRAYREVEGRSVASVGEAVWHAPAGPYTYIRLELLEVAWNLGEGDGASENPHP